MSTAVALPGIVERLSENQPMSAAAVVGYFLREEFGDQPLQDCLDAGVTGEDLWAFCLEHCHCDLSAIAHLSETGELVDVARTWKLMQP